MDEDSLDFDDFFNIISNYDATTQLHCEMIESPKNGEIFIQYSTDHGKVDDWKAVGMIWDNRGQKLVNKSSNPINRILYHL